MQVSVVSLRLAGLKFMVASTLIAVEMTRTLRKPESRGSEPWLPCPAAHFLASQHPSNLTALLALLLGCGLAAD